MKSNYSKMLVVGALAGALFAQSAAASVITPGFTFSVARYDGDTVGVDDHYHSNVLEDFGPAGKSEVGGFVYDDESVLEEVRGLSEYPLAGLESGPAFITFSVTNAGGLFPQNDFPFTGTINVYSYQGNNAEDISDYEAGPATLVGSFATAGLGVGSTLTMDITSMYNAAIAANWSSLGIRLQREGGVTTNDGAWTFETFLLTSPGGTVTDGDGDGVADADDNCPTTANADQADADNDGIGDVCDACPNDADNDADGDGVCGDVDACPNSNLSPTVIIDGCDSGVPNTLLAHGCTISDLIAHVATCASNHGQFVSRVAKLTNLLKAFGVITGKQKGAIQSCAAKSSIGK